MHSLDIMLPFWGDPSYLYETVEAVRSQDCDDWLLTVVDDCYPDPQVGEYFAQLHDPRVVYIRNERNLGITDNYRRCLELATAELVMLLGCDDLPHPDFVRRVLHLHQRFPQAHIIQPGVQIIDSSGVVISPLVDRVKALARPSASSPRLLSGEALAASLLRANWLYWPSLVFRKDAISAVPFRDGFPIIQDLALVIDMVAQGASVLCDPYVCFSYRRHAQSASSTTLFDGQRFDGERRYFALAHSIAASRGWARAARAARTHVTSRAYALALVPQAIIRKDSENLKLLLHHALERTKL